MNVFIGVSFSVTNCGLKSGTPKSLTCGCNEEKTG